MIDLLSNLSTDIFVIYLLSEPDVYDLLSIFDNDNYYNIYSNDISCQLAKNMLGVTF